METLPWRWNDFAFLREVMFRGYTADTSWKIRSFNGGKCTWFLQVSEWSRKGWEKWLTSNHRCRLGRLRILVGRRRYPWNKEKGSCETGKDTQERFEGYIRIKYLGSGCSVFSPDEQKILVGGVEEKKECPSQSWKLKIEFFTANERASLGKLSLFSFFLSFFFFLLCVFSQVDSSRLYSYSLAERKSFARRG